jgi:hypothetical protein
MNFLIQVRWSNGPDKLLQRGDVNNGPDISVTPDDGLPALSQNGTPSGCDFLIANPSSKIRVTISFKPTIGGHQAEVLSANQTYTVSGSDLTESTATLGAGATVTKHPLITLTKEPSGRARLRATPAGTTSVGTLTVFTVRVNTDFVDATEHWRNMMGASTTCMAEPASCWDVVKRFQPPGTELIVLGFTVGNPVVWFVVVPGACTNADTVSTLVFFRPATYAYSTFDDPQHAKLAMFLIGRYLVTARAPDPGVWWAWDRYHDITADQWTTVNQAPSQHYDWLCAGLSDALRKSGKPTTLVLPLPSGSDFGAAQSARLPSLLASIRALLFARGKIGIGEPSITEGRLALSGYSRGGVGLFSCLNANKAHVQEVYCFDCNDDDKHVNDIAQWAFETSNFKLRLAGGLDSHVTNNDVVARAVTQRVAMAARTATGGEVTTHPASPSTFYGAAAAGGSSWWNHVFASDVRYFSIPGYNHGTRHQFVIYGGEDPAFAPGAPGQPWTGVSFMESFLSKSSL